MFNNKYKSSLHHRLKRTVRNHGGLESTCSITSYKKYHNTTIEKDLVNITKSALKYKYIPKSHLNEKLSETWKLQEFEMSSHSSKDNYSQLADTKLIHTVDDTTKVNFPNFENLRGSENDGLQNNTFNFLHKLPNVIFDFDKEVIDLPQVPQNIIKKKTVLSKNDINTYNNKKKYYSRYVIDNLKIAVKKWMKIINTQKRESFGWTLNEEDIYNYVIEKLEPIALDGVKSDTDYKKVLKLNITAIVNDLSLFENQNSNLIDILVNEIIGIDEKIPITYIQPTDAEIKQFVKDEIIFTLDKSCITISTIKMGALENKLIDYLLDLLEIEDINDSVIDQIANAIADITKLSADKAKYFTKIILNDYKEFFFRQRFFSRHSSKKNKQPHVSLEPPDKIDTTLINQRYFEQHINNITKEIEKWFTNLNIQIQDSEVHVKELACDIIDRQKFLAKHPSMKGTITEELEYLKYQIYKRTSKLVGKNALEYAEDLMKRINNLPAFSFNAANELIKSQSKYSKDVLDSESLTDIISSWFYKLPIDVHSFGDTSFNKQLIKILAEDIGKSVNNKKLGTVDAKIDKWIKEIFKKKLSNSHIHQLKNKILFYLKNNKKKLATDTEEENIIKTYKGIINNWINTFSLQLNKEDYFFCNRDKYVHELATKMYSSINRLNDQVPSVDVYNTMREHILEWMKILPLDKQSNKCRDKYAVILVTNIKCYDGGDTKAIEIQQCDQISLISKLENAMLDCIKNSPENTTQSDHKTDRLNDMSVCHTSQEDSLEVSVEAWLNKLPIRVTDFVYFKIKKNTFIENIKLLRALGATDEIIINEIIKFMKTLPMEVIRRHDNRYKEDMSIGDEFIQDDTAKLIESTIQKWDKLLSTIPTYSPKKLTSLIDKVVYLVSDLINHLGQNFKKKHSHLIRDEIVIFLEKFPKKRIPEQFVTQLSKCLIKKLKGIIKRNNNDDVEINEPLKIKANDYDTVRDSLEAYAIMIVREISNWLNTLIQNDGEEFHVIINDLVDDIINRELYFQLNPQCRKSSEDEIKQFQFEIFKRTNKIKDIQKIDSTMCKKDLTKQIKNIPIGMFTKDSQVYMQAEAVGAIEEKTNTILLKRRVNRLTDDSNFTNGHSYNETPPKSYNKSDPDEHNIDRSVSIPVKNENSHSCYQNPKQAIFEKYQTIFKNKVYDLPILAPTPESQQLSELARTGIYNAIMKTFFSLKSDQELENDYGYFELILEDKLDEMLDLLPQTEEMKKIRESWKVSVLSNAVDMLKEMQEVSDRPSFRQRLKDGFNRKFARNFELEQCFLLQQGFLAEMAEAYILETKYKEDDPLKANIYKQRLMKKVDEMANHLTRQHNIDFRFLKKPQLIQHAMKILSEVPIPNDDILNDEVEEILLAEEIEQWYKELPVMPYINDFDQVFRKRMINILAQKIHEIGRNKDDLDNTKERQIKHEISNFLTERGRLEPDKDLNINFMVDELNNRLKNHRLRDLTNYDSFKKSKPMSSTLAKLDNTEILAPLIDESTSTDVTNQLYQTRDQHLRIEHGPTFESTHQPCQGHLSGTQYRNIDDQVSEQQPMQYSNGIPFQWPAKPHQNMQSAAQDSQTYRRPESDKNFDRAHQYNSESSSTPRHSSPNSTISSPKANFEMNRLDRQARQRDCVFQQKESHATGLNPNQNQFRTPQGIDARGTNSLSPKYTPEPRQSFTSKRRLTSPEVRGPRSLSPSRPNMGNLKAKPDLESLYTKQRPPRRRSTNSEITRPGFHVSQQTTESRMGNAIVDDDQNQNSLHGACRHHGTLRCNPNCKFRQATPRGQRPAEENKGKPKMAVKCECPDEMNKIKCLCFDSERCPCKLLIKPCKFY